MKKNQKQQTVICKEHQHEKAGKKLIKSAKGITLIALVITIIVLLILAGVTIAMLTGQNGILTNATNANIQSEYFQAEEKVKLAYMAVKTEIMTQKTLNSSYNAQNQTEGERLASIVENDLHGNRWSSQGYNGVSNEIRIEYTNPLIKKGIIDGEKPRETGKIIFEIALEKQDALLYIDNKLVNTKQDGSETAQYVAINWLNPDGTLYRKTRYKKDEELSSISVEEYQNESMELLYWQMPDSSLAEVSSICDYFGNNYSTELSIKAVTRSTPVTWTYIHFDGTRWEYPIGSVRHLPLAKTDIERVGYPYHWEINGKIIASEKPDIDFTGLTDVRLGVVSGAVPDVGYAVAYDAGISDAVLKKVRYHGMFSWKKGSMIELGVLYSWEGRDGFGELISLETLGVNCSRYISRIKDANLNSSTLSIQLNMTGGLGKKTAARFYIKYLDENGEEQVTYSQQVSTSYKDLADGKGFSVMYE